MFLTKLKTALTVLLVVAAIAVSIVSRCIVAAQATDERLPKVLAAKPELQGVWSAIAMESGGQPCKLEEAVFMVDGKRACWQTSDSEIQGGLYVDTTSEPKAYDLAMTTRTVEGIYSLKGDTLQVCYDNGAEAKRPTRFATKRGSQLVLIVLKRTHAGEAFIRLPDGTRAFPTIIEKAREKPLPPPTILDPPPRPR